MEGIYKNKNTGKQVVVAIDEGRNDYPYLIEDMEGRYLTHASEKHLKMNYEYIGKQIPIKPIPTIEPLDKYRLIGESIGKLVDEKNKQYGDSFNKSAEFLKILYPNSVPVEHYSDMLGIIRVFDKLMRIANGNQGNENGWNDICGYSILKSAE